ncbi:MULTISPECIES: membrane anchored protein in chemotaxis locus [Shewanella]|uniref:Membrane anchored protein in chemotaxis locus n=1 Tax=Shewanella polaris TaxID=2588449 RepID=A0A4Y5YHE8_9GAMM|nr:membrane anchored protein in chemotaxis locus [Shewanella polaris]QDE31913.1 membrane anchored protein in chemotaxis locus [Shewanella polaris]
MAKSEYSLQTKLMLGLFLSFIVILVLAGLYINAHRKVTLLEQDVLRLTASQVLLMVPEDQAANIAHWLTQHPEQTQAMISSARKDQTQSVLLGPGALDSESLTEVDNTKNDTDASAELKRQDVIVSENAQGVKVIRLSNGGIRVTTRDDKQDKQ